jgi:hypothetical protein
MGLFDLLFIALFLASVATLVTAAVAALCGRGRRALAILRRWAIAAAAYLAIVAAVGLFSPQRVLNVGDPWCFDDWCLSVESVNRTPAPPAVTYNVGLRIFSRARRVSQRANGAWVNLVDARGNHYAPEPDPNAVPLDVRLGPGESVSTSRVFRVPADAGELGLTTGHGGGLNPDRVIIGADSSLLHKRTYIRIR